MVKNKRIYQVIWSLDSLAQINQLEKSTAEKEEIKNEIYNILSLDPYGKVDGKSHKFQYHIKRLRYHLNSQWRLKFRKNYWNIFNYRILYEVSEYQVLVKIFKFEARETAYLKKDSLDK